VDLLTGLDEETGEIQIKVIGLDQLSEYILGRGGDKKAAAEGAKKKAGEELGRSGKASSADGAESSKDGEPEFKCIRLTFTSL